MSDTVCPICLEPEKLDYITNCNHSMHLDCIQGMNSFECPLCRTEMTNLPEDIITKIQENKAKHQAEQIEQDRRTILEMINDSNTPSLHVEVLTAMLMFDMLKIPRQFIPNIRVEVDPNFYHDCFLSTRIINAFVDWASHLDDNLEFVSEPTDIEWENIPCPRSSTIDFINNDITLHHHHTTFYPCIVDIANITNFTAMMRPLYNL